jgi:hypothetical protein
MILFNENLPIVNETKHQKKVRKQYKMKHSCPSKKKKCPMGADCNGNMNESSTQPPQVARNI